MTHFFFKNIFLFKKIEGEVNHLQKEPYTLRI